MPLDEKRSEREVVRRAVEAWNDDDWETLEALNHPTATIRAPEGWPESGEFAGWPAVRRQFERLKDAWSEERIETKELRQLGGGRVLLRGQWRGYGEASGLELDMEVDVIYTVADGRIARSEFFLNREAAERAASGEGA